MNAPQGSALDARDHRPVGAAASVVAGDDDSSRIGDHPISDGGAGPGGRPATLATAPAERRPSRRRRRGRRVVPLAALVVAASAAATGAGVTATQSGDAAATTVRPSAVADGGPAGDADTGTVEARLLEDPAVRWVGTFDNDEWDEHWGFNWGEARNVAAVEIPGISQHGRVLDVAFNPSNDRDRTTTGARMGMNRMAAFPLMGIETMEDAWFRYSVYLPEDWDAAGDGKMPGLAGNAQVLHDPGDTSGGGELFPGTWSGRVMWNNASLDEMPSRPTPRTYLYVQSIGSGPIEDHRAPNSRVYGFGEPWQDEDGDRVEMVTGEWNVIEVHYVMNTPGVEDGIFEGYLYNSEHPDGIRGAYHDTVQYRSAEYPDLGVNQLQEAHYYGGAYGPRSTQHMYFDDYVISSSQIGPRTDS